MLRSFATLAAYYLSGRLGLMLAIPPGYATAFWPPAGVALAAVLFRGNCALPAIWMGSFLLNLEIAAGGADGLPWTRSLLVGAGIGLGAAAQAYVGGWLIRRVAGYPHLLFELREIVRFLTCGGLIACLIGPTWGVALLLLSGVVAPSDWMSSWWTWWVGDVLGVLLIAPITAVASLDAGWRRRRTVVVAVPILAAFCVTVAAYVWVSRLEMQFQSNEFRHRAAALAYPIQRDFTGRLRQLAALATTVQTFPEINEQQFHRLAEKAMLPYPGTQRYSWKVWVSGGDRDTFESMMRRSGIVDFKIRQLADDGSVIVAPPAEGHAVIRFVQPAEANAGLIGLDVYAMKGRKEAMDRARDSGGLAATPFLADALAVLRDDGFLVFHPVYDPGTGDDVVQRRSHLRGFVVCSLLAGDATQSSLNAHTFQGFQVRLEPAVGSSSRPSKPVWSVTNHEVAGAADGGERDGFEDLRFDAPLNIGGQSWRLVFQPDRDYVSHQTLWQPSAVLVLGLLITGVTGSFLLYVTGQQQATELVVWQRTQDLLRVNSQLKAVLDGSTGTVIVATDTDGVITVFNAGAERLLGYTAQEVVGRCTPALFHLWEEFETHGQRLSKVLGYPVEGFAVFEEMVRLGEGEVRQWTYVTKSGEHLQMVLTPTAQRDVHGRITGYLGVAVNVTAQIKAEADLRESEERLRLTLQNARHGMWDWDITTGRIIIDENWRLITGYHPDELPLTLESWEVSDLVHPDDRDRVFQALYQHINSFESLYNIEYRTRHRSGGWIWVNARGCVQSTDAEGKPLRMLGTIHDISEQKKASEKFAMLFEHSTNAHLLFDERSGILDCNPAALRMLRCDDKQHLLRLHPARLSPERQPDGRLSLEKCVEMDATARERGWHRFEWSHLRFDGEVFPCEVTLTPVPLDGRTVLLVAWQDLTQRKLAERQLDQQASELKRSNTELEQFAYVASHDLREPLRMVQSFCGLLKDRYRSQLDERAGRYIDFAVDGAARMQRMIDDLLEYSRVGRSKEKLRKTDLNVVIRQAVGNLTAAVTESQATVKIGTLPVVLGEPQRLCQVFQNLIGNAIKFRGELPPRIEVTSTIDQPWCRITIKDHGIGIDPKHFSRLFVVFQRLHTKDQYPGTGIGLALCKRIIELHGGRIELESRPGQGTSVHLYLPAQSRQPLVLPQGEAPWVPQTVTI